MISKFMNIIYMNTTTQPVKNNFQIAHVTYGSGLIVMFIIAGYTIVAILIILVWLKEKYKKNHNTV